ncbi:MAG: nitroimidazol reductase NimA-like FMN-containing flavoprotein [Limisphaerales bacterium]|jgi:nitroimidazol reductase NimA-like FMN-containing flavoprotein (pyridoxamine 5'-phosphate oxidase superfamily)
MSGPSVRTTVKRNAIRAEYERETIVDVLQAQQICHVAYVVDGEPRQIPTLYFCDDDFLYLHGNRQSALLKHMVNGGEVCITVTLVDAMVVARSGFHCSMNYRSVTLFGSGQLVDGDAHEAALDGFVRALVPGHENAVREPTRQELAATTVVRIPLDEMSAKIRSGDPIDDEGDLLSDVWAGVLPVRTTRDEPLPAENLRNDIAVPGYITNYKYRG